MQPSVLSPLLLEGLISSMARAPSADRIIAHLESIKARKPMYFGRIDAEAADRFLSGFLVGCFACGVDAPWVEAAMERGWLKTSNGPILEQLRAHGLTDGAAIDELIEIQILAFRRAFEDKPEPA